MILPTEKISLLRRWRRRFYHRLLVLFLFCAGRAPLSIGRAQGRLLARLAWRLRPRERRRAESNLRRAFPEGDSTWLRSTLKLSAQRLGENFHDTMAIPRLLSRPRFIRGEPIQDRPSLTDELCTLAAAGRGVLILTGHMGCWELTGAEVARQIRKAGLGELGVVTGTIHNPAVNHLVQERRRKIGLKVLPRESGAGPLLRHLRNGGIAAVLLDQNTRSDNLMVPFFGHEAPTPAGFARIALRYGIPILPVAMAREGEGHLIIRGEIWTPAEGKNDDDDSVHKLLTWCNLQLENIIRRNPAEWVWFHQRWADESS